MKQTVVQRLDEDERGRGRGRGRIREGGEDEKEGDGDIRGFLTSDLRGDSANLTFLTVDLDVLRELDFPPALLLLL